MRDWNDSWWEIAEGILPATEQERFSTRCRWCGYSSAQFRVTAAPVVLSCRVNPVPGRLIRVLDCRSRRERLYLDSDEERCWLQLFEQDLRDGAFSGEHHCWANADS